MPIIDKKIDPQSVDVVEFDTFAFEIVFCQIIAKAKRHSEKHAIPTQREPENRE